MQVKVKKLHPEAVIPQYAKPGDAGLDLVAISDPKHVDGYLEYKTGLALEIPEGYVGLLFPRSSISKKDLAFCNSVGVIDSGYRGEICFRMRITGVRFPIRVYEKGDRVGQIVIMPYPTIELVETEELSDSERGAGGYGSTGN